MNATVIQYLYEDLPGGHTVLPEEWCSAMQLIKDAINNHAAIISKPVEVEAIEINIETTSWEGESDILEYTIPEVRHNRGARPQVEVYLSTGEAVNASQTINLSTGDITLYSAARIDLKVLIR